MSKKLTKKQAYKILEKGYGNVGDEHFVFPLCDGSPIKLRKDWCKYWKQINTTEIGVISECFRGEDDFYTLTNLTRLIMLNDFVEDYYD